MPMTHDDRRPGKWYWKPVTDGTGNWYRLLTEKLPLQEINMADENRSK